MKPPSDPAIQRQMEDFHRQMGAMSAFYQQAVIASARERLLKDLEEINRPPAPPKPSPGRRITRGIGKLIRQKVLRQTEAPPIDDKADDGYFDDPDDFTVTIIDPNPSPAPAGSLMLPQKTKNPERRLFDG
jgi:hypothetical protein